jgi:hypothetical protein
MAILTIFVVGMICAYACEPVDAKPIAKIKKGKKYYTAKFKYKGHTYKAKLKKNRKATKMYGDKVYDSTKKKGGHIFRLYHTNPLTISAKRAGISASRETAPGKGICIIKSNGFRQHYWSNP